MGDAVATAARAAAMKEATRIFGYVGRDRGIGQVTWKPDLKLLT